MIQMECEERRNDMPVLGCSGWACEILISVSVVPGGNPAVLAEPEAWATEFAVCEDCKSYFCDRCVDKRRRRFSRSRCPDCSGKLADGARFWEQVRGLPYPEAVTRYNEAFGLMDAGRHVEALTAFDHAVLLRPNYVNAHFYRAVTLRELGRDREAVDALDEVLRIDPDNARTAFEKGNALRRLRDTPQAIEAYRRAIAIEFRYVPPRVNLAITLNDSKQLDEALRVCDETIQLIMTYKGIETSNNTLAYAHGAKAACLLNLGRHADAVEALDAAIDSGLEDPLTHRNRAYALEKLGRHHEARLARQMAEDAEHFRG